MGSNDSRVRFSNRVEDYVKYRPGYPSDVIAYLKDEINLSENWIVADIGSGTGILTELFLKNGNTVYAVEPNKEMREAAENLLKEYTGFKSIDGSAERTTLSDNSVGIVCAGQAFHWFDVEKTKVEFERILKQNGIVLLMWNERLTDTDDFSKRYEKLLLDFSADYRKVDHRNVNEKILSGFYSSYNLKTFANQQMFDFEGLKGRMLSSSYIPKEGHPDYPQMIDNLKKIYDETNTGGMVKMVYKTVLYYGKL